MYRKTIEEVDQDIIELVKPFDNVFYLNNKSVVINGVKYVGSTYWSKPVDWVGLNDFKYIYSRKQESGRRIRITTMDMGKLHDRDLEFLEKENGDVIITHFPPTEKCRPDCYSDDSLEYFTNKTDLCRFTNVKTWISGHTHTSYDFVDSGIRFISNQIGYVD